MYTVLLLHFCGPCGAIQLEKIAKNQYFPKGPFDLVRTVTNWSNYYSTPKSVLAPKGPIMESKSS